MQSAAEPDWIAVDWGTSNVRAWGIGPDGAVTFAVTSDRGMSRLAPNDYPAALTALIGDRIAAEGPPVDTVICGMAGARQGWREAPYLETPAAFDDLAARAVVPTMPASRLRPRILPGVCQRGADDVMRGEETQLAGLASAMPDFAGTVCMPGTHSKWVELRDRRIVRFATAMTGELFDVLRTHSVLRHSLGGGDDDASARRTGTLEGLENGTRAPERLSAMLFRVRAGALLSGASPAWCAGFLSGLLIGAEIGGQRGWIGGAEVPLIGSTELARIYCAGLDLVGASGRIVDANEVTLAGLRAAREGAL